MAEHARTPTHTSRRRSLLAAASAVVLGSGITAGAAPTAADLVPADPDAELLMLRAELDAAVEDISLCETDAGVSDDQVNNAVDRLSAVCWAIVSAPPAQTSAGVALKAAAAMHKLRVGFAYGRWRNMSEAMAWAVLSPLAGPVYVSPRFREAVRDLCEPGRA